MRAARGTRAALMALGLGLLVVLLAGGPPSAPPGLFGAAPARAQAAGSGSGPGGEAAAPGAYAATRAEGPARADGGAAPPSTLGDGAAVARAGGEDLGDRAMAELRARIRGMREPLRIVMVTWRGWTDTDQGFKDYFESHRIPVDLIVRDAGRDRARLPAIVAEIRELQPDLVYTWGTSVSLGILGRHDTETPGTHITDIPAVFANVSYPVVSGLVPSLANSGRIITGSTYLVPLEAQLRAIRSYRSFETLGIIYNPTESNSRNVVDTLRAMASEEDGFTLVDRPIPLDEAGKPVAAALPDMVAQVAGAGADFLYIPPDSFLSGHKMELTAAAEDAGLPTFAAAEGTLENSRAMMGLISRYYNIGKLTAHLATRILVGREDPASIPISSLARYSLVLNMDVIRTLEFYPPIGLLQISEIEDSRADGGGSVEEDGDEDQDQDRPQTGGSVR
ncbi:ABC transporter substrate-binding protein [Roseospira visakhapatnamensis]|uniref:Putative ABC transport system substrate-binding protein n=1 Tax=Roseospira visakhapatnamensis TaxID=390880 RepID=A0A7W6RBD7_9PROT|nr:ABC transporter substrate-binding protein [Roseospira visakhapatnamensis]MBB4264748.1 putative ABC transport system substrate-binding protein [Roseospira visakhapatnamensis]